MSSLHLVGFLSLLLIAAPEAAAQTIQAQPAEPAQTVEAPSDASPFGAAVLDDSLLGKIAGREDTNQAAFANQSAGVVNSSVSGNSQTGDARISDSAFQNLSGLSLLNVNTGNNVAINAAMNVNISISPAP